MTIVEKHCQHVRDLQQVIDTIENDNKAIPEWLWNKIQALRTPTGKPFSTAQVDGETHEYLEPVEFQVGDEVVFIRPGKAYNNREGKVISLDIASGAQVDFGDSKFWCELAFLKPKPIPVGETLARKAAQTDSEFTPGPWKYVGAFNGPNFAIMPESSDKYGDRVALVEFPHSGFSEGASPTVATHNARLIASAPDLLSALEIIKNESENYSSDTSRAYILSVATKAINKARGK
jgi:hypothetical protein